MQGWRLDMEDEHVTIDIPSQPDHIFVAVFDGHCGDGAAIFAAKYIISTLERTQEWQQYVSHGAKPKDIDLLSAAMTQTFLTIDSKIRDYQGSPQSLEDNYGKPDVSGCTCVTAVITPEYILCANAGDSRCALGTNGRAKEMSKDHKPNNPEESKRIAKAGGIVQFNRVDANLAVSRGLGDFGFKARTDLPPHEQKVSCLPEIVVHERTSWDEVLLLACDGLWYAAQFMASIHVATLTLSVFLLKPSLGMS